MTEQTALDRPLPQTVDMERAVLGSILINNAAFWRVQGVVDVEDFYRPAHKTIYRAIAALVRRSKEADLLTIKDELGVELAGVGGSVYISSLIDHIPDAAHVERYAEAVAKKGKLRRIITTSNDAMQRAFRDEEAPEVISSDAVRDLQIVSSVAERESRPVYDVALAVDERVRQRAKEGRTRAIVTGMSTLDYHRCIRRKALIIIGAPTSHGKTTFMLNLSVGALEHDMGVTVANYSLEMSDEDVIDPLRSMLSGVRLERIQDNELNPWERKEVDKANDWLKQRRQTFYFADKLRDIDALYADCHKRKLSRGLDLVMVDYLQLVRGFDERTREQEVDRIARSLFLMAQDLDIAVVTGSQVNKEREKRSSGRLSVLDLKHGAVIGEHARVVLLFQRPRQDDKSNQDKLWCETVFQIEKNSGRKTGDVPMHADLAVQRFAEGTCRDHKCRYAGLNLNEPKEESLFENERTR